MLLSDNNGDHFESEVFENRFVHVICKGKRIPFVSDKRARGIQLFIKYIV